MKYGLLPKKCFAMTTLPLNSFNILNQIKCSLLHLRDLDINTCLETIPTAAVVRPCLLTIDLASGAFLVSRIGQRSISAKRFTVGPKTVRS